MTLRIFSFFQFRYSLLSATGFTWLWLSSKLFSGIQSYRMAHGFRLPLARCVVPFMLTITFVESPQRFSRSSQLVLALFRFIMIYKSFGESRRLVKAIIPTFSGLQLKQIHSYIGGYFFTELGLAKYMISLVGPPWSLYLVNFPSWVTWQTQDTGWNH